MPHQRKPWLFEVTAVSAVTKRKSGEVGRRGGSLPWRTSLGLGARTVMAVAGLGVLLAAASGCTSDGESDPQSDVAAPAEALGEAHQAAVSTPTLCTSFRSDLGTKVNDASVYVNKPDTNYGAATSIIISGGSASAPPAVRYGLFRFDLSAIPSDATVLNAGLTFNQTNDGVVTGTVHRIINPWDQATVTWNSFNSAFDPAVLKTFSTATAKITVDILPVVKSWVSNALPNHGVVVATPGNSKMTAKTSEWPIVTLRPYVSACYKVLCTPGHEDCNNSAPDGCETDTHTLANCGGCGTVCSFPHMSASCATGACAPGACDPGFGDCDGNPANGCETDLSADGNCGACGVACDLPNAATACVAGACALVACADGAFDCDGNQANGCEPAPCSDGSQCAGGFDCESGVCAGGICAAPSCVDTVQNGVETDVDCGGACAPCAPGLVCNTAADCQSSVCAGGACQFPSCFDAVKNGTETDVDCGGACGPCAPGKGCASALDCTSFVCFGGLCNPPSCADAVKNGAETDVDCGGACPSKCAVGKACGASSDCATNLCMAGTCHAPVCGDGLLSVGEACDDGNATNGDGCSAACVVQAGYACAGSPSVCSALCGDGVIVAGEACDDGNVVNGDGCSASCLVQAGYACAGSPSVCTAFCSSGVDDGNACTTDTCDPATGQITHTPVSIDDGNVCTTDSCSPATGVSHTPVSTDDGNACTTDSCDPMTGVTHTPVSTDDGNACTTDSCNAATGVTHTPVSTDDGNACTTDGCNPVTGVTHTPVSTDDGNACTTDGCNAATGVTHTPVNVDDGNACTTDSCNAATGVTHTPVNVDDGNACTTDSCNAATGVSHTPAVTCFAQDQCHSAGVCDPGSGACSNPVVANGTSCNDGNGATSNDVCTNGSCAGSVSASCNDGIQNQGETGVDCGGPCAACGGGGVGPGGGLSNTVSYNGYYYATLDDAPADAAYGAWVNTCQNGSSIPMPSGWELAPESAAVVSNVIAQHVWSTHCLLFSNGVSYGVSTYNNGGACGCSGSECMTTSGNSYQVTSCSRRILIRRAISVVLPAGCVTASDNTVWCSTQTISQTGAQICGYPANYAGTYYAITNAGAAALGKSITGFGDCATNYTSGASGIQGWNGSNCWTPEMQWARSGSNSNGQSTGGNIVRCTNLEGGGACGAVAPTYLGQFAMDTHSHGGGYSPSAHEYWYPEWAGNTVYRYNENYQSLGTFTSQGNGQIMQLAGDSDGSYYTANWSFNTIQKLSSAGGGVVWTYNMGTTASAVAVDGSYVYAMSVNDANVWQLNKATGALVSQFQLSGGGFGTLYGGLAVANGKIYRGNASALVEVYDLATHQLSSSFTMSQAGNIYNMAFTGTKYCVSPNSSTVTCYTIANCSGGAALPAGCVKAADNTVWCSTQTISQTGAQICGYPANYAGTYYAITNAGAAALGKSITGFGDCATNYTSGASGIQGWNGSNCWTPEMQWGRSGSNSNGQSTGGNIVRCTNLEGASATCSDGIQNQGESGVDCGGPCSACATCSDGIQNQGESGVDCGGPCSACATCSDGIQNQGEGGVDCGGPCSACATCSDGIQNQGESGVDCGGPCSACAVAGSITKWSEGTAQWPDQACNSTNSFGGCNTNDQTHANAWATYVCQLNGYATGVWTGNKAAGCNGNVSMYCAGQIPCTPVYENSCSPGDQTKIEITCSGGTYPNGMGGSYTPNLAGTEQQNALLACESVWGGGQCANDGCGSCNARGYHKAGTPNCNGSTYWNYLDESQSMSCGWVNPNEILVSVDGHTWTQ